MSRKLLLEIILEDLRGHGGKSFGKGIINFVFNMSFRLTLNYRIGFFLASRKNIVNTLLCKVLKNAQIKKRSCDISYRAKIGRNVKFPHPIGIVIGENVEIGDDVMIWQHVTLGSHGRKEEEKAYPVIMDKARLYTGCQVLGKIRIGYQAVIGANAVVIKDVPDNNVAVGIPAKNIERGDKN